MQVRHAQAFVKRRQEAACVRHDVPLDHGLKGHRYFAAQRELLFVSFFTSVGEVVTGSRVHHVSAARLRGRLHVGAGCTAFDDSLQMHDTRNSLWTHSRSNIFHMWAIIHHHFSSSIIIHHRSSSTSSSIIRHHPHPTSEKLA